MTTDAVRALLCCPKISPPRPSHHLEKIFLSIDFHPYYMRPPLRNVDQLQVNSIGWVQITRTHRYLALLRRFIPQYDDLLHYIGIHCRIVEFPTRIQCEQKVIRGAPMCCRGPCVGFGTSR